MSYANSAATYPVRTGACTGTSTRPSQRVRRTHVPTYPPTMIVLVGSEASPEPRVYWKLVEGLHAMCIIDSSYIVACGMHSFDHVVAVSNNENRMKVLVS